MEVDSREQGSRDVVSGVSEPPEPASRKAVAPGALCERLRPGPGRMAHEQVVAHQRTRLQLAMIEAVSERGFGASTIRELAALAGVSTRTFYERFAGKHECFLCTYDVVVGRAVKRIVEAQRRERDWRARLRRAFEAFAHEVVSEPKAARVALVEAFGAGPMALERMERASATFEQMIAVSFEHAPDRIVPPPIVITGIVAGVARVARVRLLDGRAHELVGLADELMEWVLSYRFPAVAPLDGPELRAPPEPGAEPALDAVQELGRAVGEPAEVLERRAGDADDRARIMAAAMALAAQGGCLTLTAGRIAAAAGVPTKRFSELFEDCGQCVLEALELACGQAMGRAVRAGLDREDWPDGVQRAVGTFAAQIAADPVFASVAFIEVFALGPAGLSCREALMRGFAEMLRSTAPPWQRPSELAAEASVGAAWGIMHHHVARGQASRLPGLTRMLSYVLLAPAIGAEQAVERIAGERERTRTSGRASRAARRRPAVVA